MKAPDYRGNIVFLYLTGIALCHTLLLDAHIGAFEDALHSR
jgi:hypothetical protein